MESKQENLNKKKTIIVVVSSRGEIYDHLIKEYWIPFIKYVNSKDENIKILLIFGNDSKIDDLNEIKDNILVCPFKETWINMYFKTIYTFNYIDENMSYDYILRTNLSSFFVYDNLKTVINNLDEKGVYSGVINDHIPSFRYISGAGFFLSKDMVEYLLEKLNNGSDIKNFTTDEDVDFGILLNEINKTPQRRYDIIDYNTLDKKSIDNHYKNIIKDNHYHVRIKNPSNRYIDVEVFKNFVDKLYK